MQVMTISTSYASFMQRLVASIIDYVVLGVVFSLIFWWTQHIDPWTAFDGPRDLFSGGFFFYKAIALIVTKLYYAIMESSAYQGTFGKIALGLKVVDNNGQPIDFSKALLRNLSKLISTAVLMIGYFMIIFSPRKQGLHDVIADTLVVKQ